VVPNWRSFFNEHPSIPPSLTAVTRDNNGLNRRHHALIARKSTYISYKSVVVKRVSAVKQPATQAPCLLQQMVTDSS